MSSKKSIKQEKSYSQFLGQQEQRSDTNGSDDLMLDMDSKSNVFTFKSTRNRTGNAKTEENADTNTFIKSEICASAESQGLAETVSPHEYCRTCSTPKIDGCCTSDDEEVDDKATKPYLLDIPQSMPKNWMQVEKLKMRQRQILHQQGDLNRFGDKGETSNIKQAGDRNNLACKSYRTNGTGNDCSDYFYKSSSEETSDSSFMDMDSSDDEFALCIDDEADESSENSNSLDANNRVPKDSEHLLNETVLNNIETKAKKMTSNAKRVVTPTKFSNSLGDTISPDLCLLTASKINDSLQSAIASVDVYGSDEEKEMSTNKKVACSKALSDSKLPKLKLKKLTNHSSTKNDPSENAYRCTLSRSECTGKKDVKHFTKTLDNKLENIDLPVSDVKHSVANTTRKVKVNATKSPKYAKERSPIVSSFSTSFGSTFVNKMMSSTKLQRKQKPTLSDIVEHKLETLRMQKELLETSKQLAEVKLQALKTRNDYENKRNLFEYLKTKFSSANTPKVTSTENDKISGTVVGIEKETSPNSNPGTPNTCSVTGVPVLANRNVTKNSVSYLGFNIKNTDVHGCNEDQHSKQENSKSKQENPDNITAFSTSVPGLLIGSCTNSSSGVAVNTVTMKSNSVVVPNSRLGSVHGNQQNCAVKKVTVLPTGCITIPVVDSSGRCRQFLLTSSHCQADGNVSKQFGVAQPGNRPLHMLQPMSITATPVLSLPLQTQVTRHLTAQPYSLNNQNPQYFVHRPIVSAVKQSSVASVLPSSVYSVKKVRSTSAVNKDPDQANVIRSPVNKRSSAAVSPGRSSVPKKAPSQVILTSNGKVLSVQLPPGTTICQPAAKTTKPVVQKLSMKTKDKPTGSSSLPQVSETQPTVSFASLPRSSTTVHSSQQMASSSNLPPVSGIKPSCSSVSLIKTSTDDNNNQQPAKPDNDVGQIINQEPILKQQSNQTQAIKHIDVTQCQKVAVGASLKSLESSVETVRKAKSNGTNICSKKTNARYALSQQDMQTNETEKTKHVVLDNDNNRIENDFFREVTADYCLVSSMDSCMKIPKTKKSKKISSKSSNDSSSENTPENLCKSANPAEDKQAEVKRVVLTDGKCETTCKDEDAKVPFVDFPARIVVSTDNSNLGAKTGKIVPTKGNAKSIPKKGQDTGIDFDVRREPDNFYGQTPIGERDDSLNTPNETLNQKQNNLAHSINIYTTVQKQNIRDFKVKDSAKCKKTVTAQDSICSKNGRGISPGTESEIESSDNPDKTEASDANPAKTVHSLKRKSQLIESYYTSSGSPTKQPESKKSLTLTCEGTQKSAVISPLTGQDKQSKTTAPPDQNVACLLQTVGCHQRNATNSTVKVSLQKQTENKRFIKTKFIILKGDICDRWLEVKKNTGFGEMSDPKFVHYLLKLEETRQERLRARRQAAYQQPGDYNARQMVNNDVNNSAYIKPIVNIATTDYKTTLAAGTSNLAKPVPVNKLVVSPELSKGQSLCNSDVPTNSTKKQKVLSSGHNISPAFANNHRSDTVKGTLEAKQRKVLDSNSSGQSTEGASPMETCSYNEIEVHNGKSFVVVEDNDQEEAEKDSDQQCGREMGNGGTNQVREEKNNGNVEYRQERSSSSSPAVIQLKSPVLESLDLGKKRKRPNDGSYVISPPVAKRQPRFLSEATEQRMQWAVKMFRDWLEDRGENSTCFETRPAQWLDKRLAKFYRTTNLGVDILQEFRRSLSLYLSSYNFSKNVTISIALDKEYEKSNMLLTCLQAANSSSNTSLATVVYPITEEDMDAMYDTKSLSDDNPMSLSNKVWFDVTYHLCKGNLPSSFWRTLNKHDLHLASDVDGVYYMFSPILNVAGVKPGKMYATPDDSDKCPVRTTSLYLSKLNPNSDAFFQYPVKDWKPGMATWYSPVTIRQENLDNMMVNISFQAKLSRIYTNDSVIFTASLNKSCST